MKTNILATEIATLERKIEDTKSAVVKKTLRVRLATLKKQFSDAKDSSKTKNDILSKAKVKVEEMTKKDFNEYIKKLSKNDEYKFLGLMTKEEIIDDIKEVAKPVGWRFKGNNNRVPSKKQVTLGRKSGDVYYENRSNHSDVSRVVRLEKGGEIEVKNGNTEVKSGNWTFYFKGKDGFAKLEDIYHRPTDLSAEWDKRYNVNLSNVTDSSEKRLMLIFEHPTMGNFNLMGGFNIMKERPIFVDGSMYAKGGDVVKYDVGHTLVDGVGNRLTITAINKEKGYKVISKDSPMGAWYSKEGLDRFNETKIAKGGKLEFIKETRLNSVKEWEAELEKYRKHLEIETSPYAIKLKTEEVNRLEDLIKQYKYANGGGVHTMPNGEVMLDSEHYAKGGGIEDEKEFKSIDIGRGRYIYTFGDKIRPSDLVVGDIYEWTSGVEKLFVEYVGRQKDNPNKQVGTSIGKQEGGNLYLFKFIGDSKSSYTGLSGMAISSGYIVKHDNIYNEIEDSLNNDIKQTKKRITQIKREITMSKSESDKSNLKERLLKIQNILTEDIKSNEQLLESLKDNKMAKGGAIWKVNDVSKAKHLGIIEFQDNEEEYHNFEIMETEDRLVFGGFTNSGFIESGYIEKDGMSTDEALQELTSDLETYYNDGEEYTSMIVVNKRMAKGGGIYSSDDRWVVTFQNQDSAEFEKVTVRANNKKSAIAIAEDESGLGSDWSYYSAEKQMANGGRVGDEKPMVGTYDGKDAIKGNISKIGFFKADNGTHIEMVGKKDGSSPSGMIFYVTINGRGLYAKEYREDAYKLYRDEIEKYNTKYAHGGSMGSNNKNGKYLDSISSDKKSKILKNIASHYGFSVGDAEEEVRDADAEMLYEYIANDQSLRMNVYNDMERGKMAKGGELNLNTYKLRAEGLNDFLSFLQNGMYMRVKSFTIEPIGVPDVVVSFVTDASLSEIKSKLKEVQDSHVMLETVKPINEYTGERYEHGGSMGYHWTDLKIKELTDKLSRENKNDVVRVILSYYMYKNKEKTIDKLRELGAKYSRENDNETARNIAEIFSILSTKMEHGGEVGEKKYVKVDNKSDAENILFYADKQDIASSYRKSEKDGSYTIIFEKKLEITNDMQPRIKEILENQKTKMAMGGNLGEPHRTNTK